MLSLKTDLPEDRIQVSPLPSLNCLMINFIIRKHSKSWNKKKIDRKNFLIVMWNVCQEFFFFYFHCLSLSLSVMSECDLRDKRLTISVREEVPHHSLLVIWYIFLSMLTCFKKSLWMQVKSLKNLQLYKYRFYKAALVYLFVHSRVRKISYYHTQPLSLCSSSSSSFSTFSLMIFFLLLCEDELLLKWSKMSEEILKNSFFIWWVKAHFLFKLTDFIH